MYLDTLTKLNTFATANPAKWPALWTAMCGAHGKYFGYVMQLKWSDVVTIPTAVAYAATAEEKALEESLNSVLVDQLKDGSSANDRQFHKVLSYIESTESGKAMLEAITPKE